MAYYRDFNTIVIKGSPDYERSMAAHLDKVWGTWTGWAVIRSFLDTGRSVTIIPFSPQDKATYGDTNGLARATSPRDAAPVGVGTGKGSDVVIRYSESELSQALPTCSKTQAWPCLPRYFAQNRGPDDTLLHELVHALREARGQFSQVPVWDPRYDNQEEYFAILVQNTYASEKGMTILRRDHKDKAALRDARSTSEGFLGRDERPLAKDQLENRLLVQRFARENFGLCQQIANRVTARFNPIGEYLRNPFRYPYDPKLTAALAR